MVGGIAQEIDARSDVLRIERELEEARSRLTAIRRAKYRGEGGDSDAEGYMSGYDSSTMETTVYRTNLNGSENRERSPAPPPPPHYYGGSQGTPDSASRVRQVYQVQQQMQMPQQQQGRQGSLSPVPPPKKQPPATPPRLSSVSSTPKTSQTESPLMILQRQRQLLESATNNVNNASGIEDHAPSFAESRQRFNNTSNMSSSTFNTSTSSFHQSPQQLQGASVTDGSGGSTFYSSTVRSTEQVQHTQRVMTQRSEKISTSSSSKVYQTPENK